MEKLSTKLKKKVNNVICSLPVYHEAIPLQEISNVLEYNGLIMLQEDNTEWSGLLCGTNERVHFDIAFISSKDNNGFYKPIKNTLLNLSWYKMPSGRYEIVTYLG